MKKAAKVQTKAAFFEQSSSVSELTLAELLATTC